jgi:hypothetical protein
MNGIDLQATISQKRLSCLVVSSVNNKSQLTVFMAEFPVRKRKKVNLKRQAM